MTYSHLTRTTRLEVNFGVKLCAGGLVLRQLVELGRQGLFSWIERRTVAVRTIRGIRVVVENTRPDVVTAEVFARLDGALGLIEQYSPAHFRRLRRDFAQIVSRRYPCRGAYLPQERTCLVELTFTVNPSFTLPQVAATILHEAMHARLHRMGVRQERLSRAREERFCRRAEIEFGQAVPGGEPVVRRALESLAGADEEIAPVIDWALASQRVAQADLEALDAPLWVKRAIARRRDLTVSE
jgi:hypothetical protein